MVALLLSIALFLGGKTWSFHGVFPRSFGSSRGLSPGRSAEEGGLAQSRELTSPEAEALNHAEALNEDRLRLGKGR